MSVVIVLLVIGAVVIYLVATRSRRPPGTGRRPVPSPRSPEAARRAVQPWIDAGRSAAPRRPVAGAPFPGYVPPRHDLALNESGAALARRAVEETGSALGDTPWHLGLHGEERMDDLLLTLEDREWRVLPSVRLPYPPGGDIDHLVIAEAGVWAVNTKRHPGASLTPDPAGTVRLNDNDVPQELARARAEAACAQAVLSRHSGLTVRVQPVLAYVDALKVTGVHSIDDPQRVIVAEAAALVDEWMQLPEVWSGAQVERLYQAARDARHWQDHGEGST